MSDIFILPYFYKLLNMEFIIDVAIIGAISSGKSMFLNALFSEHYAENKIKRTTMCPQIYVESNEMDINIYDNNKKTNLNLLNTINSYNDLPELEHKVNTIQNLILTKYRKFVKLNIHDLPGLNDVKTKDIYYDYVRNNFLKYDIVVYIIDIKTALNTTDEADILDLILKQIHENKIKYDINTELIILINKCDNMRYKNNKLIIDTESDEYQEMYEQILNIITNHNSELNIKYSIVPISCENAFIYNLLTNAPKKLTEQQMNKMGINYFGCIYWNKLTKKDKRKRLVSYFKDKVNKDVISNISLNNGFLHFKDKFNTLFEKKKLCEIVQNKTKRHLSWHIYNYNKNINNFISTKNYEEINKSLFSFVKPIIYFLENFMNIFDMNIQMIEKIDFYENIQKSISTCFDKLLNSLSLCGQYSDIEIKRCTDLKNFILNLENYHCNTIQYFNIESIKLFKNKLNDSIKISCERNLEQITKIMNDEMKRKITYNYNGIKILLEHDKITNLFNIMINYAEVMDISDYVVKIFNNNFIFYNCCFKSVDVTFSNSNIVTHDNIVNILEYYKLMFSLDDELINNIYINIVKNMYYQIYEQNIASKRIYSPFFDSVDSMLFQMNKFWNDGAINDLLKKEFNRKEDIQEIQYLANVCQIKVTANRSYAHTKYLKINNLLIENKIFNYLSNKC